MAAGYVGPDSMDGHGKRVRPESVANFSGISNRAFLLRTPTPFEIGARGV